MQGYVSVGGQATNQKKETSSTLVVVCGVLFFALPSDTYANTILVKFGLIFAPFIGPKMHQPYMLRPVEFIMRCCKFKHIKVYLMALLYAA